MSHNSNTREDDQHGFPGKQPDFDDDLNYLISAPLATEEKFYLIRLELQPDDFVLMKFPIVRGDGSICYMANVLNCFE